MPSNASTLARISSAPPVCPASVLADAPSAVLADARVATVRVRVEKLHALPGAESGGVEIERTRD